MKDEINIKLAKKYLNFLEENKDLVGLSDWSIKVNLKKLVDDEPGTIARAIPDLYEQTLTILLTKEFLNLPPKQQQNVLLHELIHGRVSIFNIKVEDYKVKEEEYLVNDLTRGLERLNEFKL